jgi:hypothetical protein
LDKRRSRLSHPKVRSTIQRQAWTTKPLPMSERFTTSTSMPLSLATASIYGPA